MQIIYGYTKDNLNLQGIHWESKTKNTCIVFVHGMSGNIIENKFAEILGNNLSKEGYGFIYGHNRGYSHINDIKTSTILEDGSNETKRIGVTYEKFENSIYDIDLWINEAKKYGYKKIILIGHSLGCNKIINFLYIKKNVDIFKTILISPPDVVGLAKLEKYQPNYNQMLDEAERNMKNNKPRKLLTSILWDWYYLSSATFLNLCKDGCPADNLPLVRNPVNFQQLENINIPILALLGGNDDIIINSLEEDLNQIKNKAISCPKFDYTIIKGANHTYDNKEEALSTTILNWLSKD